ncbi:hypothetical protein Hanom_Chr03g00218661 [Helianthus anomalus]
MRKRKHKRLYFCTFSHLGHALFLCPNDVFRMLCTLSGQFLTLVFNSACITKT